MPPNKVKRAKLQPNRMFTRRHRHRHRRLPWHCKDMYKGQIYHERLNRSNPETSIMLPLIHPASQPVLPSSRIMNPTHAFFLFTRPARPLPKGLVREKSTCFWLSTRTMKEATLTICLPTLQWHGASSGGQLGAMHSLEIIKVPQPNPR